MKVYLAGRMTGLPNFNYDAFNEAAAVLRSKGYEVCNPVENFGGDTTLPYKTYIREDFRQLLECEAIVALPDSHLSAGAIREMTFANWIGMPVYHYEAILAP